MSASEAPKDSARAHGSRLPDALGLLWVVLAAVAVLVPALIHGMHLGPYDLLSDYGLTQRPGVVVHNPSQSDQITLFIPWSAEAWTQVHAGHLPLWNQYSGLGLPLAFNWQSGTFALPSMIGYLVPLQYAYTVALLVTSMIAGTGAYVFARLIRLGVIASAFVGTVFVLSGPMASLLGWSSDSVASWAGWLFAAALLVLRGKDRVRSVVLLAVVVALAIYAGYPETLLFLLLSLALFLLVVLIRQAGRRDTTGPVLSSVIDLGIAGAAGAALAAPLALPGLQLARDSSRATAVADHFGSARASTYALHLVFQGFDGLPVPGNHFFGPVVYQGTALYLGTIALVMAIVALGTMWRRPDVIGLASVSGVMAILVLVPAIGHQLRDVPLIGAVVFGAALVPFAFGLSCLAGIGLHAVIRDLAGARRWALAGFALAAVLLVAIWCFGRGHLPPDEVRARSKSFLWPAVSAVIGVAALVALNRSGRRAVQGSRVSASKVTGAILLATESVFLVAAGAPLWSSSPQFLVPTTAVSQLQRSVGSSLVGFGTEACLASAIYGAPGLGILPGANGAFRVQELAIYDPIAPADLFSSWQRLTGKAGGLAYLERFCPAVTSASVARRFGIGYVLEARGASGPPGSVFVRAIENEDLYRIPGSSRATLVKAPAGKPLPSDDTPGIPVSVRQPDPGTWSMVTASKSPQVLRVRVTDVPGWRATVDGHSVPVERFSGTMLQFRIPPGRHDLVLHYWPALFTAGLIVAACSTLSLITALTWDRIRRSRRSTSG